MGSDGKPQRHRRGCGTRAASAGRRGGFHVNMPGDGEDAAGVLTVACGGREGWRQLGHAETGEIETNYKEEIFSPQGQSSTEVGAQTSCCHDPSWRLSNTNWIRL